MDVWLSYYAFFIEGGSCKTSCSEGTLLYRWWECELVQPLWRTVWRYLIKLNTEPPYDPGILLLGIYPDKTVIQKDTCTPMFIAALSTIAKAWKQPKCPPTNEWIKTMWYINIYTVECYSAIKKKEIMPLCRNMDGPRNYHTKWSQTEKDKYHMKSLICGI